MHDPLYGPPLARYAAALRERATLTSLQSLRLWTLVGLADHASGRFVLADALRAGDFPDNRARAQDALQDFRKALNSAARDAGVNLVLELSSHKTKPEFRYGWFTTGDLDQDDLADSITETDLPGRAGTAIPISRLLDRMVAIERSLARIAADQAKILTRLNPGSPE